MLRKRLTTGAILLALIATVAYSHTSTATLPKVSTVSAKSFNQELRTRRDLTGKRVKRYATKPVRAELYQNLRSNNVRTKQNCRKAASVRATWYTDAVGYRGDRLAAHPKNFAELSKNPGAKDFSALGGLAYKTGRWFHHKVGRRVYSVFAKKRDIGAGGPRFPKVDLWKNGRNGLADLLHFSDGKVRITKLPCRGAFT